VELKGSKSHTKVVQGVDQTLEETLRAAVERARREFSSLDWEYMEMRERGELFVDVGLTLTPLSDEPLVGMWDLESLEASYGAGGYTNGTMHHLNTLSRYGGLQATLQKERQRRTHILYRQDYNLVYELIRKRDNSREMFTPRILYDGSNDFETQYTNTIRLLQDEGKRKSYGVRNEVRVGIAALREMEKCIDQVVSG